MKLIGEPPHALALAIGVIGASSLFGEGHRVSVSVSGSEILLDGQETKIHGLRCSNALMSDRSTDDLIHALDLYREYGLTTVSVFLMGSRFGEVKGFLPDGSLTQNQPR